MKVFLQKQVYRLSEESLASFLTENFIIRRLKNGNSKAKNRLRLLPISGPQ